MKRKVYSSNPFARLPGDIAEGLADQTVFLEIVTFTDQSIPTTFLLRCSQIDSEALTEFYNRLRVVKHSVKMRQKATRVTCIAKQSYSGVHFTRLVERRVQESVHQLVPGGRLDLIHFN